MSKFCPFCGEELVDSAKFCKNCGKNIEDYQKEPAGDENTYQFNPAIVENDHTLASLLGIVFAILVPLIGIIIGIYVYTRKDSSKAHKRGISIIALSVVVWIVSSAITFMYGWY